MTLWGTMVYSVGPTAVTTLRELPGLRPWARLRRVPPER